ncbi:MAG: hypothetical protein IPM99_06945 [Rubrivivax sp.]|nr:hypothetical protein [Rubrivivax sp.]
MNVREPPRSPRKGRPDTGSKSPTQLPLARHPRPTATAGRSETWRRSQVHPAHAFWAMPRRVRPGL